MFGKGSVRFILKVVEYEFWFCEISVAGVGASATDSLVKFGIGGADSRFEEEAEKWFGVEERGMRDDTFKPVIRILLREEPSSFIEFISASLLLPLILLRSSLVVPLNNESSRVLRFL